MGIGTSGAHLGSNPDGFHDFLRRCLVPLGGVGMVPNAIRTLCNVRYGHSDQLFGLRGKRPLRKHGLTECLESLGRFGGQTSSLLDEFTCHRRVDLFLLGDQSKLLS